MKIKPNAIVVLSMLVLVIVVGTAITIYSQMQNGNTSSTNKWQDTEPATIIEDKPKTKREKEHGKLFKGYGDKKIKELGGKPSDDMLVKVGAGLYNILPDEPPFNPQLFLAEIGCDADAVIVGTPEAKISQITEDEKFIFTDYGVNVDNVLKDNQASFVQTNGNIVITRTGGKIKYKERRITAVDEGFKPFRINSQYLLFLKYLPATKSYQAFRNGSFRLQDNNVEQLGGSSKVIEEGTNPTTFMTQVQNAIASSCGNRTENSSILQ